MCAGLVPTRLVSLYHGPAWLTQHTLNTGQISPQDELPTAPLGKLLISLKVSPMPGRSSDVGHMCLVVSLLSEV